MLQDITLYFIDLFLTKHIYSLDAKEKKIQHPMIYCALKFNADGMYRRSVVLGIVGHGHLILNYFIQKENNGTSVLRPHNCNCQCDQTFVAHFRWSVCNQCLISVYKPTRHKLVRPCPASWQFTLDQIMHL